MNASFSRRRFLGSTGALTAAAVAGALGRWGVESANAQGVTDYKAMVCIFLFGGNDSNNLIVPVDDYAQYAAVRTATSNIALTSTEILSVTASSQGGKKYGFHPQLAPLKTLYDAGKLAVIANAGTLVAPITKADYQAGRNRPLNLFSHSDQQSSWQGYLPDPWGDAYEESMSYGEDFTDGVRAALLDQARDEHEAHPH